MLQYVHTRLERQHVSSIIDHERRQRVSDAITSTHHLRISLVKIFHIFLDQSERSARVLRAGLVPRYRSAYYKYCLLSLLVLFLSFFPLLVRSIESC